jgi:hypothetical protein
MDGVVAAVAAPAASAPSTTYTCSICNFVCNNPDECSIHAAETEHTDCYVEKSVEPAEVADYKDPIVAAAAELAELDLSNVPIAPKISKQQTIVPGSAASPMSPTPPRLSRNASSTSTGKPRTESTKLKSEIPKPPQQIGLFVECISTNAQVLIYLDFNIELKFE